MENKVFQEYETPQLEIVEIDVEQGFAISDMEYGSEW